MWQRVYQTKFHNATELNQRVLDMRHCLKQSVIDDAFRHQLRVINDAQLISVVNVSVHVFMYFPQTWKIAVVNLDLNILKV